MFRLKSKASLSIVGEMFFLHGLIVGLIVEGSDTLIHASLHLDSFSLNMRHACELDICAVFAFHCKTHVSAHWKSFGSKT